MKDRKFSFLPYSMVNKQDEERFFLCPPIKLLTDNLLNSSKEPTVFRGMLQNHTHASPLRVVGKVLHIISSETAWKCIVVLKIAIWSKRSRVPSYKTKKGILNIGGKGWLLMEVMKGEFVRWTKSSTRFAILMFSFILSMALLIWSISISKCGTLHEIILFDWFSASTFSSSLTSWLWACPSAHLSWHCLLRLISLVNFWF